MGWPLCNRTLEYETIDEVTVWHGMTFHRFGLIVSATFALIAVLMSFYLIWRHATHYHKPWEQRHIIRVLFMVPIYSIVSFMSYIFYRHAVYFEVIRDCYEAFAIASFFALLCHYIATDLHSQKDYFRGLTPRGWVWPLSWMRKCCGGDRGLWRTPRSGLTWFNIIWLGVFQYCFIRVFMTLVAVVTQAAGRYCLESLNPAFAHIWVMVIEGGCVTIAMYCLIQFYIQLKHDLADHKPLLKVAAIKLVIFLSFWQTLLISFLTSAGVIQPSKRFQTPDIKIGIPSLLLCIEMAIFSVFHLWAFPWTVYDVRRSKIVASESAPGFLPDPETAYHGGHLGINALMDAFNPWDLVKAVGRGFKWFAVGRRTRERDISYKNSAQGTNLEPSRDSNPYHDPYHGNAPYDHNDFSTDPDDSIHPYARGKPSRYNPLDEDEEDNLLANAQPVPHSPIYSQPKDSHHIYQKTNPTTTDISTMDRYSESPDRFRTTHPNPNEHDQRSGTIDAQDTGYHGARLTPIPPRSEIQPPPEKLHDGWDEHEPNQQRNSDDEHEVRGRTRKVQDSGK